MIMVTFKLIKFFSLRNVTVALFMSFVIVVGATSYWLYPIDVTIKDASSNSDTIEISYMGYFTDSTISKVVPAFRFNESKVGEFLDRFADSICAASSIPPKFSIGHLKYNVFMLFNLMDRLSKSNKRLLPKDTIIYNYIDIFAFELSPLVYSKCVGVIVTSKKNVGILTNIDERWIETLELKSTGQANIELKKYIKPVEFDDSIMHWRHDENIVVDAILGIMENGKVNPIQILNTIDPIQLAPMREQCFDWIESFYHDHDLPEGCEYYRQDNPVKLSWDGKDFMNYPEYKPPFIDRYRKTEDATGH